MKVKELISQLEKFDLESTVFLLNNLNENICYESFVVNKSVSVCEHYLIKGDFITDGAHVFDEDEYLEYVEDLEMEDDDILEYSFYDKVVVINGDY
jgi:hypothetical protein